MARWPYEVAFWAQQTIEVPDVAFVATPTLLTGMLPPVKGPLRCLAVSLQSLHPPGSLVRLAFVGIPAAIAFGTRRHD